MNTGIWSPPSYRGFYSVERYSLWDRQNRRCIWCNRVTNFRRATVDHIVPLAFGGTNSEENLAMACEGCNQERSVVTRWFSTARQLRRRLHRMRLRIEPCNDKRLATARRTRARLSKDKGRIRKVIGKYRPMELELLVARGLAQSAEIIQLIARCEAGREGGK